jgi:hypothetical protein
LAGEQRSPSFLSTQTIGRMKGKTMTFTQCVWGTEKYDHDTLVMLDSVIAEIGEGDE